MEKLIKVIADMWVYEMNHENPTPDELDTFREYLSNKVLNLSEAEQEAVLDVIYEELGDEFKEDYDSTVN